MTSSIQFESLVNFTVIERLLKTMFKLHNIPITIIDKENKFIFSRGFSTIDNWLKKHTEMNFKTCIQEVSQKLSEPNTKIPMQYRCPLGFSYIATSIIVKETTIASLFIGPVLVQENENYSAIETKKKFKKENAFASILNQLEALSPAQIEHFTELCEEIADIISGMATTTLEVQQQVLEKMKIKSNYASNRHTLSSIYSVAPVALGVLYDKQFIFVNEMMVEMLSYSYNELLGQSITMLIPPDSALHFEKNFAFLQKKPYEVIQFETKLQTKEKAFLYAIMRFKFVNPQNLEEGIAFTILDISQRKHFEKELIKTENHFTLLAKNIEDAFWLIEDNSVVFVNKRFEKIFQLSPTLLDTELKILYSIILEEDFAKFSKHMAENKNSTSAFEFDFRVRVAKQLKWISLKIYKTSNSQSKHQNFIIFARDITKEKQAIKLVQKNEERFRELFKRNPLGYQTLNQDGTIELINDTWLKMFNYEKQTDVQGKLISDFVAPKSKSDFLQAFQQFIENGFIRNARFRFIKKSGSTFIGSLSGEIQYASNKTIQRLHCVLTDVTKEVRLVREKMEAEKLAERSLRLASLGTLAGGISHEINQPLTAIKTEADGLLLWHDLGNEISVSEALDSLKAISGQTDRITDIIQHMRSLIRSENYKDGQSFDINNASEKALSLVRQQIMSHDIKLICNLPESPIFILGSNMVLEQIIINLVINAMQALDTISNNQKEIIVQTKETSADVFIEILDNGPGISNDIASQIFDPFFTTKIKEKGMGLGLSIVENFVTGLNGKIKFENRKNGGVKFSMCFPKIV